ncbi:DUF4345 domain-containing protein [Dyadobacter sp. LHD-138]|uniref:DUF4345 domain-containing protein n=1 Tax=Dyadobacter sp. LHD-138 TaxID=3071413 RepID=UPI0027E1BB11|nr:DUF4345 domain-containing protein [Dyadobacter sp. LHD-138]MDQ6479033.1 DUF4345 domain-containing protein [Dyadobacter sp. LHD-138]
MKIKQILSQAFIILSALSIMSVSIMAFDDPQSVMDLVQVTLPNNDAFSSIRGVYGGAGFAIVISLLYSFRKHTENALAFLMLLWGFYALSRMITIFKDGPLGDFGNLWIKTESVLFIISCVLFFWNKRSSENRSFN